jgi:hypothetical protein
MNAARCQSRCEHEIILSKPQECGHPAEAKSITGSQAGLVGSKLHVLDGVINSCPTLTTSTSILPKVKKKHPKA